MKLYTKKARRNAALPVREPASHFRFDEALALNNKN